MELTLHRNEKRKLIITSAEDCHIVQEEASELEIVLILIGGSHSCEIHIDQAGTHCQTHLYGIVLASETDQIGVHTHLRHLTTDGTSTQLFKYILAGQSQASFKGELYIAPDAQRTNAQQTNRNILLSPDAKIHTEPQLEIYADDVKASHGASTGQLDDSTIFYMQQRGISTSEARLLLLNAFAADILQHLDETERQSYAETVEQFLRQYATE